MLIDTDRVLMDTDRKLDTVGDTDRVLMDTDSKLDTVGDRD